MNPEEKFAFQDEYSDGKEEKQAAQFVFKQQEQKPQQILEAESACFWERQSNKKEVTMNSYDRPTTGKKNKKKQKKQKTKQLSMFREQFGAINDLTEDGKMNPGDIAEKMIELSEYILSASKESRVIVRSLPVIYLSGTAKEKYYLHSHGNKQFDYTQLLNTQNHQLVTHIEFMSVEQEQINHIQQLLINQKDEGQQLMISEQQQQQQSSWLSLPLEPFLSFRIEHYDGYLHKSMIVSCGVCKRKFIQGNRIILLPCQHIFHSRCALNLLYLGSIDHNGKLSSHRKCVICDIPFRLSHQHDVLSLNVVLPKPLEGQLLVVAWEEEVSNRQKNGKKQEQQGIQEEFVNWTGKKKDDNGSEQLGDKIDPDKDAGESMNLIDKSNCRVLQVVQSSEVITRRQQAVNQLGNDNRRNQYNSQEQFISREQRNLGEFHFEENDRGQECKSGFCCQDHEDVEAVVGDTQIFQDLKKKRGVGLTKIDYKKVDSELKLKSNQ